MWLEFVNWMCLCDYFRPLFVFQNDDSQQNVNYFLTPVFNLVFNALSHGTVLLSMVAKISTFWLVEIPQQPIRISQFTGFLSYHGEKKETYHVKERKNSVENWLQKWVYIFWGVITLKNKQCSALLSHREIGFKR